MKPLYVIFVSFCFLATYAFSQSKELFSFSVVVTDGSLKTQVEGANVLVKELKTGCVTGSDGTCETKLPEGKHVVVISAIGYVAIVDTVYIEHNIQKVYSLKTEITDIDEITISSELVDRNVSSAETGVIEIKMSEYKNLPAFMGENDPMSLLQHNPGIQTTGDGNTGLYVRGGAPGNNLILFDDAVIYNPAHLLGLFSVFNSNAVENLKLVKSGIPSEYGGRLASVLEVEGKYSSMSKLQLSADAGLLMSGISAGVPFAKGKGSVSLSARKSYFDIIKQAAGIIIDNPASFFQNTAYSFYDMNILAKFILSEKDIISFSSLLGNDNYKYRYSESDRTGMFWGNNAGSLKWTHYVSDSVYFSHSVFYSAFDFDFSAEETEFSFKLSSGVRDAGYKCKFNLNNKPRHKITMGYEYILHNFSPVIIDAEVLNIKLDFWNLDKLRSHEAAFYTGDIFKINDRVDIYAGLRYSLFFHVGPYNKYLKDPIGYLYDTVSYLRNEIISSNSALEPRFSAKYSINNTSSLKASASYQMQYIHFASLPSVSMPVDIWLPSTNGLKPESCLNTSLGYFRNFYDNGFESSIDVYFRKYYNVIEFKNGLLNSAFYQTYFDDIAIGNGTSYGLELSLKKNMGNFTGWVSYTLSKSMRKFDDINEGRPFSATFDRRHDFSIILNYKLKKLTLSSVFVFASGNAITLPDQLYIINQNIITEYAERNSFRLPSYNRLDLAVTYKIIKTKKIESDLTFSIYNVYNRANPFFVYFETTGNIDSYQLNNRAKQISLFPVLPFLHFTIDFL